MKELHIPYGLKRLTREIIEPEDAEQGRACDCLCPGCEAPLLSRHPKSDKRIHFAHDSKHPEAKPVEECPLSPYVALGMMLRHIADSLTGKTIKLNGYYKHHNFDHCSCPITMIHIVDDQELVINGVERSPMLGGVQYDLSLSLGGKSYFFELIHPGKTKKELPAPTFLNGIGGIICISGPEFTEVMARAEFAKTRYSDAVCQFLLTHSRKFWAFHYLEPELTIAAQSEHTCRSSRLSTGNNSNYSRSYTPNHSAYSREPYNTAPPVTDHQKATQEAAAAYLKASTGDTAYRSRTNSGAPIEQRAVAGYKEIERSYLLPPSFQMSANNSRLPESTQADQSIQESRKYECVFCSVEFSMPNDCAPNCPQCRMHLGARPI